MTMIDKLSEAFDPAVYAATKLLVETIADVAAHGGIQDPLPGATEALTMGYHLNQIVTGALAEQRPWDPEPLRWLLSAEDPSVTVLRLVALLLGPLAEMRKDGETLEAQMNMVLGLVGTIGLEARLLAQGQHQEGRA